MRARYDRWRRARVRADRDDARGVPPGSKDAEFLRRLGAASGQLFRGNELVLTLKSDSGSMTFVTTRQ